MTTLQDNSGPLILDYFSRRRAGLLAELIEMIRFDGCTGDADLIRRFVRHYRGLLEDVNVR